MKGRRIDLRVATYQRIGDDELPAV